jgi:predicted kinase
MVGGDVKGLWNIVLSGYPTAGKTMLAQRLLAEKHCFARVGVDELRRMFFDENYPCHDEFVVYSMIGEIRDDLLKLGYSVVIDSTAPFNVTRQFLLTTSIKPVNPLLVVVSVDRSVLTKRTMEKFGDNAPLFWRMTSGGKHRKAAFPCSSSEAATPKSLTLITRV